MPEVMEATIENVQHDMDTGWYRIKTDRGRLDTKIAEKAQEAIALKGQPLRIFFTTGKASGNTNPHTGQPYPPPRYYERAEALATGNGAPQIEQVSSSGGGRRGMDRDEVWRICLSVGVKAAIDTLPLMPVEQRDFGTQQRIALAWGRFLFFQKAPELGAATPQTLSAPDPEQGFRPFAGEESPPPDDDIPF